MTRIVPLFLCLAVLGAPVRDRDAAALRGLGAGAAAPEFEIPAADGTPLRLSALRGDRATVLLFWATWSPRSPEALADCQELFERHRDAGLSVVAVNVDGEGGGAPRGAAVAAVADRLGLAYPLGIDTDLSVFRAYGVVAVPSLVLLDGGGRALEILDGYARTTRDGFREKVRAAVGAAGGSSARARPPAGVSAPRGTAGSLVRLGGIYLKKRRADDAVRVLRRAVAEDPEYEEAFRALAEALALAGRPDEAHALLARWAARTRGPTPE